MSKKNKLKIQKKKNSNFDQISDFYKDIVTLDPESDSVHNISCILDHFKNLREKSNKFINLLLKLSIIFKSYDNIFLEINSLIQKILIEYKYYHSYDISIYESTIDYNTIPSHMIKEFKFTYCSLKKSVLINSIILITQNILLCVQGNTYEQFLQKCYDGSTTLSIFKNIEIDKVPLTVNLVSVFDGSSFSSKFSDKNKKKIFLIIERLSKIGKAVNHILTKPDINIQEIFPKFLEGIKELLGRCSENDKEVVGIIENSADIFEKNFNKYFKNFIKGNDKSSLFTDFINDISENILEKNGDSIGTKETILNFKKLLLKIKKTINKNINSQSSYKLQEDKKMKILELFSITDNFIDSFTNNSNISEYTIEEIESLQENFAKVFFEKKNV